MRQESRELNSEMMASTPLVKLYDVNSDKWVCQNRRRLYCTNIPWNPDDVHTTPPLHLKDLVGDGYEGVVMLLHGCTKKDAMNNKFIPDRKVTWTLTKSRYFTNSTVPMNAKFTK